MAYEPPYECSYAARCVNGVNSFMGEQGVFDQTRLNLTVSHGERENHVLQPLITITGRHVNVLHRSCDLLNLSWRVILGTFWNSYWVYYMSWLMIQERKISL